MSKISIIIPTYKAVEHLEICLKSLTRNVDVNQFEVIVICDGHFDLYQDLLQKYNSQLDLKIIKLDTNRGIATAINYGVYCAKYETILVMNDDNIAPKELMSYIEAILIRFDTNFCISFRQIEPRPSIFRKTMCINLGQTPDTFDWYKFDEYSFHRIYGEFDKHLGTFPFIMNKKLFMTVGGFSDEFGSKVGFVSDWDFFTKVSNILEIQICNNCYFYHFSQVSSSEPTAKNSEQNAHEFFKFKWGEYGQINTEQTTYLN